jgi:hypothetical protein
MTAADLQHFADLAWQGAHVAMVVVLLFILAMAIRLAFRTGR